MNDDNDANLLAADGKDAHLQKCIEKHNLNPKQIKYVDNPDLIIDIVKSYEFSAKFGMANTAQIPKNRLEQKCHDILLRKYIFHYERGAIPPPVSGWSNDDLARYYKTIMASNGIDKAYFQHILDDGLRFYWFMQAWNDAVSIDYPFESPLKWVTETYDLSKPTRKQIEQDKSAEKISINKDTIDEATRFHTIREAYRHIALKNKRKSNYVFRGEPIKMIQVSKPKKPIIIKNFIDEDGEDYIEERPDSKQYLISYRGTEYRREEFLKNVFPEYKKYPYKIKFNTDDIYLLGGNQRAKLQYHILAQHFQLVHVSEQDKEDLSQLLINYREIETARRWLDRMAWENGFEKLISFGVALEVRGKIRKVWCYSAKIGTNSATYTSDSMTWEKWAVPIIAYLDSQRKALVGLKAGKIPEPLPYHYKTLEAEVEQTIIETTLAKAQSMLFFQGQTYLTLPGDNIKILLQWIYDYWKKPTDFPYSGKINDEEYEFTINFNTDIEIVRTHDLKTEMSEYNQEHNAEHNKAMGYKQTKERFEQITGEAWTTQELLNQGISRKTLDKFVEHGLIRRIKRGHYVKNSV